MRSMLSNVSWRAHSARFLRRNCSAGAKTTDEKAAEVSKEAWPTLRKYAPIWIPVLLASFLTIDVINSTSDRNAIEPYAPSYIEFVRKYYGFEDEDPVEIRRVKETLKVQAESVSAVILLSSGVEIIEENVDGTIPYIDFYESMRTKYSTEGQIQKITFVDSVETEGENDCHSMNSNSSQLSDKNDRNNKIEISLHEGELIYKVAPVVIAPLTRSLWEGCDETIPSSSSKTNAKKNEKNDKNAKSQGQQSGFSAMFGQQKTVSDSVPLDKYIMASRFEGVLSTWLADWKFFKTVENPNILVINGDSIHSESKGKKANNSGGRSDQMSKLMQKEDAKKAIVLLEAQLLELRVERKRGTREIDQIDAEIQQMNNEITRLKRTHLNNFYYF